MPRTVITNCPGCKHYVRATACPGQTGAPVVYARYAGTGTRIFSVTDPATGNRFAYSATFPGSNPTCCRNGSICVTLGSCNYASCAAALADTTGATCKGQGYFPGGGVPGAPGGGNLPLPGPPPPKGTAATFCPKAGLTAPPYNVWMAHGDPADGTDTGYRRFRVGRWCFECNVTGAPTLIPGGTLIEDDPGVGKNYSTCTECYGGVQAGVCFGQNIDDDDPPREIWVPAAALPVSGVGVFRDGKYCRFVTADAVPADIPKGARVMRPGYLSVDCDGCVGGVVATPCPGYAGAPPVWVPVGLLPLTTIYFKLRGWCYSLNPADPVVPRPLHAEAYAGCGGEYGSCAACACGERTYATQGIKWNVCAGQADGFKAQDLWTPQCALPDKRVINRFGQLCYSLNPATALQLIPAGAILVNAGSQYPTCRACKDDRVDDPHECPPGQDWGGSGCVPAGGACSPGFHRDPISGECVQDPTDPPCTGPRHWDGKRCRPDTDPQYCADGFHRDPVSGRCLPDDSPAGWPPDDPNRPPGPGPGSDPDPDPDPTTDAVLVRDCTTNEIVGSVFKTHGLAGKILGSGESGGCTCYRVTTEGIKGESLDPSTFTQYATCLACQADCKFITLTPCDDTFDGKVVRVAYWNQGGSRSVGKIGDKCYVVAVSPQYTPAEVASNGWSEYTPSEWYDSCADAACEPFTCYSASCGCCYSTNSKCTGATGEFFQYNPDGSLAQYRKLECLGNGVPTSAGIWDFFSGMLETLTTYSGGTPSTSTTFYSQGSVRIQCSGSQIGWKVCDSSGIPFIASPAGSGNCCGDHSDTSISTPVGFPPGSAGSITQRTKMSVSITNNKCCKDTGGNCQPGSASCANGTCFTPPA